MRRQNFFEHQVQSLKGLVQRWHASGGTDISLEARVRGIVARDLMSVAGPEVTVRVLGELDVLEADILQDMITLCSQSFLRTDAVWNAFAVPVAVQWHMQHHRIYIAKRAEPYYLNELAAGIRQCLGAERVVLDGAIYSADVLYRLSAHALHDQLQSIAMGGPRFTPRLQSMALRSASEPPWRMVYFLGLEITKPDATRRLHESGVQDALQSYLYLGADALTKSAAVTPASPASPKVISKFELGAHGNTICHAPRYLFDAIHFGEKARRGYCLRQLLEEMAKVQKQFALYHAFNPGRFAVDLLLEGKWLAYEMQWKMFVAETVEDALRDVQSVIDAATASVHCDLIELDAEDFQDQKDQTGLSHCQVGKGK
jgi:hypothetical protein